MPFVPRQANLSTAQALAVVTYWIKCKPITRNQLVTIPIHSPEQADLVKALPIM